MRTRTLLAAAAFTGLPAFFWVAGSAQTGAPPTPSTYVYSVATLTLPATFTPGGTFATGPGQKDFPFPGAVGIPTQEIPEQLTIATAACANAAQVATIIAPSALTPPAPFGLELRVPVSGGASIQTWGQPPAGTEAMWARKNNADGSLEYFLGMKPAGAPGIPQEASFPRLRVTIPPAHDAVTLHVVPAGNPAAKLTAASQADGSWVWRVLLQ